MVYLFLGCFWCDLIHTLYLQVIGTLIKTDQLNTAKSDLCLGLSCP